MCEQQRENKFKSKGPGAAESSQYGPGAVTHKADWQVAFENKTTTKHCVFFLSIILHISKLYYIGISVNKPQMIMNILLKSSPHFFSPHKQQHDGPTGCGHRERNKVLHLSLTL